MYQIKSIISPILIETDQQFDIPRVWRSAAGNETCICLGTNQVKKAEIMLIHNLVLN
jgi:hypothetical protein